jgi:hypothetical protein
MRKDGLIIMGLFTKKVFVEEDLLINEINRTKLELETVYSNFENVVDPDLIDCYIYEIKAVQKKYIFLIKQAKASGKTYCQLYHP